MNRRSITPTVPRLAPVIAVVLLVAGACTAGAPAARHPRPRRPPPRPRRSPPPPRSASPVMLGDVQDLLVLRLAKPTPNAAFTVIEPGQGRDLFSFPDGIVSHDWHTLVSLAADGSSTGVRGDDARGRRRAGPDLRSRRMAPADDRRRQGGERPVGRRQHARARGGGQRRPRRPHQQDAVRGRLDPGFEGSADHHPRRRLRLRRPLAERPVAVPPRVRPRRRRDAVPGPQARGRDGQTPGWSDRRQAQPRRADERLRADPGVRQGGLGLHPLSRRRRCVRPRPRHRRGDRLLHRPPGHGSR